MPFIVYDMPFALGVEVEEGVVNVLFLRVDGDTLTILDSGRWKAPEGRGLKRTAEAWAPVFAAFTARAQRGEEGTP